MRRTYESWLRVDKAIAMKKTARFFANPIFTLYVTRNASVFSHIKLR